MEWNFITLFDLMVVYELASHRCLLEWAVEQIHQLRAALPEWAWYSCETVLNRLCSHVVERLWNSDLGWSTSVLLVETVPSRNVMRLGCMTRSTMSVRRWSKYWKRSSLITTLCIWSVAKFPSMWFLKDGIRRTAFNSSVIMTRSTSLATKQVL